jgi:hypothetical protein
MGTLKVASVQLDSIPAAIDGRSALRSNLEPLLWGSKHSNVTDSQTLQSLGENFPSVALLRRKIQADIHANQLRRLEQLFNFLIDHGVELCVLPEYSLAVSPETLDLLLGFAPSMAIVAGIGIPFQEHVESLRPYCQGDIDPNNNCAIVFSPSGRYVVTKANPSLEEVMVSGNGPEAFTIELPSGPIRLGVAICKDYLIAGHAVPELSHDSAIDILAIPAYSPNVEPFAPDAPRDFPRVFANCAKHGGSTIWAPGCSGPLLVGNAPIPLPPGVEGLVIVEWHGAPRRPTGLTQVPNSLRARGAILSAHRDGGRYDIATALLSIIENPQERKESITTDLQRWATYLERGYSDDDPLRRTVALYRRVLADGTLTVDLGMLIRAHLLLKDSSTVQTLRSELIRSCYRELQHLVATATSQSNGYQELLEALPVYGALQADYSSGAVVSHPHEAPDDRVCHFSIGLGPYDGTEAQATLWEQLDLLRAFARSAPSDTSLVFKLLTRQDPAAGGVSAHFVISAFGNASEESREYFKAFQRVIRPVFLRGWSLYGGVGDEPTGQVEVYFVAEEADLQIRKDWGILVDVLRSVGGGCTLEIEAQSISQNRPNSVEASTFSSAPQPRIVTADLSEHFFGKTPDNLDLGIIIRMRLPARNAPLYAMVASVLFGDKEFRIVENVSSVEPMRVPVNRAHRILHPPHGHIEGRGIGNRVPLRLHIKDDLPPRAGAVLGRATIARPFVDETIDAVLPDAGRTLHTYVVGRTGSGKTNTLKNVVRHDMEEKFPLVVIDPHGELYDYCVRRVGRRIDHLLALDLSDQTFGISINPIYLDATTHEESMRNVDELVEILVRRGRYDWYGPRFSDLFRLAVESLMVREEAEGRAACFLDIEEFFVDADSREAIRQSMSSLHRPDLAARWRGHNAIGVDDRSQVEQWFLSKLGEFRSSTHLRSALSGTPTVSLVSMLKMPSVILVKIPESQIGVAGASLIGSLLLERIVRFALGGGFTGRSQPVSIVVDEFQKFIGKEFARLVPEARKFNVALLLANQTLSQLSEFDIFRGDVDAGLRDLILGNVGNFIVQSIGHKDATVFGAELEMSAEALGRIDRYEAVVSVTVDGRRYAPFTARMADASGLPGRTAPDVAEAQLLDRMREVSILAEAGTVLEGHAEFDDGRKDVDVVGSSGAEGAGLLGDSIDDGAMEVGEGVTRTEELTRGDDRRKEGETAVDEDSKGSPQVGGGGRLPFLRRGERRDRNG